MCVAVVSPLCAAGQTYDTPATLVVVLSHPTYMYVDHEGYATVTGVVKNNSGQSHVGNVQIVARFYDDTTREPLDVRISAVHMDVLPPGASSPFTVKTSEPNPRYTWATASLLLFDPANPKANGMEIGNVSYDNGSISLNIHDTLGAPHTNVRVHTAYHGAFDPPRILSVNTHHLGDMDVGGNLNATITDEVHYGVKGFTIFVESDFFSGDSWSARIPADMQPPMDMLVMPQIRDVWLGDDTERVHEVSLNHNVSINAEVQPGEGHHRLYFQVADAENSNVQFLGGADVGPDTGMVSMDYVPAEAGRYYVETFLWGPMNALAQPGPVTFFVVE